ncbi:TolB family protein [Streptomyces sp. NPDC059696]|uniref:TolB family protein n=1 Tax=Streptomyces sp. NPDC059696 TaxID=3346911 RepID=UPI0036D18079
MNRLRTAVRWAAALVVGATLVGAGCDAPGGGDDAGNGDARGHGAPVLAFVRPAAGEIVLADATGRTWRGARLKAEPDDVRWSPDGSTLAWIDEEGDASDGRRIHRLDVATSRLRSTPCPCHGVGFLGDEAATLTADGDALLFFAADGKVRRAPLSVPLTDYATIAAGGRDAVTIANSLPEEKAGRGQFEMVAADRSGKVRPFLPAGAPTSFAQGEQSPDGRRIAWASADSGGACWNVGSVRLAAYGVKGRQEPDRPTDAAMTDALLEDRVLVSGLAWAGRGLTVTFGPQSGCQAVPPARFVSYYLRDGRWRFIGSGMLAVGYGRQGRAARLLVPERPAPQKPDEYAFPLLGDLVFTDGRGARHDLGSGVSAFVFTPVEAAGAGAPPTAAQPGRARVAKTGDRGEPVPAHLRALAQRIRDAAEDDDVARLRALCDPCDDETRAALRTSEGRRELVRLLGSHPGRTDNGIVFPGLAAHRCVDEPARDITCTAAQLADIALLDIPVDDSGTFDSDTYNGSVYEPEWEQRLHLKTGAGGKALWVGRIAP